MSLPSVVMSCSAEIARPHQSTPLLGALAKRRRPFPSAADGLTWPPARKPRGKSYQMDSFRELLTWLEARGELATVSRAVDPKHELTAVMRHMQKGANRALLFRNVQGSDIPVATNIFGHR